MASGAKKMLVTGGAGFIGSHLVEALAADGAEVLAFDNLATGHRENLNGVKGRHALIEGDIRDTAALAAAMRGVEVVFHEAAMVSVPLSCEKPRECHEVNATGTLNVLLAAREAGVKRVVMASTAAAYGNNPTLPKRESMRAEPESPYGLTKVTGEYYLRSFAQLYGMQTVALRYFNVYGPRQDPKSTYSGVISKFVDVLMAGGVPTVFGDGRQTRDFVFVKDVVQANVKAMLAPALPPGEVINVGTAKAVSLLELLAVLGELTGQNATPSFLPPRAGDVLHSLADISQARRLLGYEPQTSIREGLQELLRWKTHEK
jgi:UDP-glucose 4-epimerase